MSEAIVDQKVETSESLVITPRAAQEILNIRAENNIPEDHTLRVGVKGGGCSGMSYVLAFDEKPREGDKAFEVSGIKLHIDSKSLFYLSGTTLDFSDGLNGKGFVFNNPQAARTCGCGSSFGV